MSLKVVSPDEALAFRDRTEETLQEHVSAAMRSYLTLVTKEAREAVRSPLPNALLAASSGEMPTLGDLHQSWAAVVDEKIMAAVRNAYIAGLKNWTDQGINLDSPSLEASRDYLAKVRDRLVVGTHMGVTVYGESFDKIRASLARSLSEGWTRDQLATRIASELAWEERGPYWRSQLSNIDSQMDEILDALGEPGSHIRETARLSDPRILNLRNERNYVIKHLDAEKSVWQTRATLIARTEATGASNFGGLQAFVLEGVATKVWLAALGGRTRPTHAAASDQEVKLDKPFIVGGALMQYPGDPAGPIQEVANCRCTMVQGEALGKTDDAYSGPTYGSEELQVQMRAAESQRVMLEKSVFDKRGNLNADLGWTFQSRRAWTSYTEMGHTEMNLLKRNPAEFLAQNADDPSWVEAISTQAELLESVIKAKVTDAEMYVARGISHNIDVSPGDFLAEPGFLSTTSNIEEALNFAGGRGAGAEGWTFVTRVPKGTNTVAGADYQNEIIFAPGSKMKVLGIDRDKRIIYTEMV